MIGFLFFLFGVLVTLGMCAMAAVSDFKGFRIPNIVSVVIIIAFVLAFGVTSLTGQREFIFGTYASHGAAALVVLVVTAIMFCLKQLGAGDSKFATAVALWVGLSGLAAFLFYMAMAGGVIAGLSLALKQWKPLKNPPAESWLAKAQEGHPSVPYGIAIALGALASFVYTGYFSPDKWQSMFVGVQ